MEHGLASGSTVVETDVVPIRLKLRVQKAFHHLEELNRGFSLTSGRVEPTRHQPLRHDQSVAWRRWVGVSDREDDFIAGCPLIRRYCEEHGRRFGHAPIEAGRPIMSAHRRDPTELTCLKSLLARRASVLFLLVPSTVDRAEQYPSSLQQRPDELVKLRAHAWILTRGKARCSSLQLRDPTLHCFDVHVHADILDPR